LTFINHYPNTVYIIVGPTAVGKTSFAIQLAQHLHTKIISADSRQCFKELNIGVAKPTIQELSLVEHYFINSHSIHEEVNAGVFEKYALKKVEEIFKKHQSAVMVGGTGLYINAFCNGIDAMPEIPSIIREKIISSYKKNGLNWLREEIKNKDPEFWHSAEQQNPQRLMRALEIYETTGKSINFFKQNKKVSRPFNIIKIGLELPKEKLVENINLRVDEMVENGLIDEVKSLIPYKHLNALQTVGYKELYEYFDGNCSVDFAIERIKINTRQYAKRQMTWFKKDDSIQWINLENSNSIENIIMSIKN
jgi:tRNA dimethylallyltransferase